LEILERHAEKWIPEPNTGCYLWMRAIGSHGRPMVGVAGNKTALVSRLVCEEAHGPPPTSKHQAAHSTFNGCVGGLCIAPDHLRWATDRENKFDFSPRERSEKTRRGVMGRSLENRDNHRNRPRNLARLAGERTYLSGNLCKSGHNGPRLTSSGDCLECRSEWNASRIR
jgi:hypothetical protein